MSSAFSHSIVIGQRRNFPVPGSARLPSARPQLEAKSEIERHIAANFYPTPPEATRALLSVETFAGSIWEPACGKGHIARVLTSHGNKVVSTDLNDWGYGMAGVDFLKEYRPRARHIVTNPPYGSGLADAFIEKALALTAHTAGKTAMLLNLSSLAHTSRTPFWRKKPPARIYAIDGIVCWPDPVRPPPRHFTQHRYCWCVWEPCHAGPPAFWWLSASEFRTGEDHGVTATRKHVARICPLQHPQQRRSA